MMKSRRQLKVICVAILMMLSAFVVVPLVSASETTVTISDTNLPEGESTIVPIMINDVTDVGSCDITLEYVSSVVIVTSVSDGDFDVTMPTIDNTIGIVRVVTMQTVNPGLDGDIIVANVELKAVGSSGETSPLDLTVITLKDATPPLEPIAHTVIDGTFSIGVPTTTVMPFISAKDHPEKLESALYQLTQVQNPDEFAKTRGLYLEDGKVRVVIELHNASDTIPDGYGATIETRYGNLVQALVPIGNLINLSNEPNINFIRAPLHAYPQETSESETQIPLTLIWMCVGIIIVIIAVTAVVYLKTGLKR